jgi:hypothetical protein
MPIDLAQFDNDAADFRSKVAQRQSDDTPPAAD